MFYVGRFGQPWRQPPPVQPKSIAVFSSGILAYSLTCDVGAYALSGQAASLLKNSVITADAGAYTLTGQTVALLHGRLLPADAGAYTLSGQAATLTVTVIYTLACDVGAYTLSGQSASFSLTPRDCPKLADTLTSDGAMAASMSTSGSMSTRLFPRC